MIFYASYLKEPIFREATQLSKPRDGAKLKLHVIQS